MPTDWTGIATAAISGLSGVGLGIFTTRAKKDSDNLAVVTNKDEIVLVHYDKIVDQLQEEVTSLRSENAEVRKHNMKLERDVLEMSRQMLEISRELEDLKRWITSNMENRNK